MWLEVGVALMYGKQKENRERGQKFSEWVNVMFPELSMRDASDAQWFAENLKTVSDSCRHGKAPMNGLLSCYKINK